MKNTRNLIAVILLLITAFLLFVPVATFEDNSADAMLEDIDKQAGKVEREQAKWDRDNASGKKTQEQMDKQQAKIDKEKAELEELKAQYEALSAGGGNSGIKYALLPSKLPAEIQVDMTVVNANANVYPVNFSLHYVLVWVAFVLLVIAAAMLLIPNGKLVSKFYTYSSFANLAAILLVAYGLMRVRAIPVKLPYGNAKMNGVLSLLLLALPSIALLINCTERTNTKRSMIYTLCIAFSALSILPFWLMIVNATRNSVQIQSGVSLLPSTFLDHNISVLRTKDFQVMTGFKNSAIIAFGSTIVSVYFSALTAYGLTVYKFKGSKFLYALVLAIIMIPGQVTGTGFFMFMYRLGWTNSYLPLIIPAIASASTVFFFKQYLEANFQISLVEAARIDGAGEFYTYNTIIMPIMVPAMATMGIMAVISSWNNYLTPLMLLTKKEMATLPMMVKELRGDIYRTEYGSIYLGLTMTALPLMIVYFCFSKYIIAGVAVGGVKE